MNLKPKTKVNNKIHIPAFFKYEYPLLTLMPAMVKVASNKIFRNMKSKSRYMTYHHYTFLRMDIDAAAHPKMKNTTKNLNLIGLYFLNGTVAGITSAKTGVSC